MIFHTIAIVPTLSVCINSEQNKLSPLRVFKPQTPKVQVFEADDIPISHRASLLFVLSPLAEQVCTGFCSVQRTTDFTKIRHPYLGEREDKLIQYLSSLVLADSCLKFCFSFTRDSYKSFLLRHGSFSYVIVSQKNVHTR